MTAAMKSEDIPLLLGRKGMTIRQYIKEQRHHFADKGLYSQGYGLSSNHVQMWELDCKEGWALKNWGFRNVVLEKTLESPLDSKEIKPANTKRNPLWIFIGRTDAEAPILGLLIQKADSLETTNRLAAERELHLWELHRGRMQPFGPHGWNESRQRARQDRLQSFGHL